MKILVLISFALTAIASTRSTNSSKAYDITSRLNNTITQNFRSVDTATIYRLIRFMERLDANFHERFGDFVLGPFQGDFYYFTGITIYERKLEFASLRHEFHRNRMALFFTSLSMYIMGDVGAPPDIPYLSFGLDVNFENITIYVEADPQHKFSKNEFYTYIDFDGYECNYINSLQFHEGETPEVQLQLETQIKEFSPSLFEFNLQNNEQYMQILPETFCDHPEKFISHHPLLNMTKTKNYFFIPNFISLDRTLSNITITGMHNFDSYSIDGNLGSTVSTLTIKDIRGTTNLHYGDRNFTIFPLCFEVDSISITVDQEQQSINVTAHNYTVIETKMNVSLMEYQSKWVMEGIQLAIASSIMPSMKYYRNRNNSANSLEEHPIVKISTKLSQQFEGSTIQKLYDTWNITIAIPESFNAESSIQIESNIYNISIDAKPEIALNPYPASIKCSLFNNLQFHFTIPSWLGKISVLNTTHEFDDIEFQMGRILVTLDKKNNTRDFELHSFVLFYVELLSNPCNFADHERLQIQRKTQQLMISLIEKTVIFFAEPLLSLPLDYCTTPVKIFDDFLPFYADHELPFHVPDDRFANEFTETNVTNMIITQWTKSPTADVLFKQKLLNGRVILSSTLVDLQLAEAEIRMNFNHNNETFDERHLTLVSFIVRNYTDSGKIGVYVIPSSSDFVELPENNYTASFCITEIFCIQEKFERILPECFNNLTSLVF